MDVSLRERKKTATRQAIYAAAYKLFQTQGYSKTTLSDIAKAADVAERTIFSYFPSKEAIIFEKHRQIIDKLFAHIDQRRNQSVLEALQSFVVPEALLEQSDNMNSLLDASIELKEYLSQYNASVEKRLVGLIASEKNLSVDSIQAHLIAASCRAVIDYVMRNQADMSAPELGIQFIEAGLRAITE